jgi:hypothetical protein
VAASGLASERVSPRAPRIAATFAIVWGLLTIAVALLSSSTELQPGMAAGMALGGMACITIGLGVSRGSRSAAWCLVGLAVLDIVARLLNRQGGAIFPLVLLWLALRAASYLQKHGTTETEAQTWTRIVYQLAFFQAAFTTLLIVLSMQGRLSVALTFDPRNLFDAALLAGLGAAAYARKTWAVYALVGCACLNAAVAVADYADASSIEFLIAKSSVRFEILTLYALGAYYVRRYGFSARAAQPSLAPIQPRPNPTLEDLFPKNPAS